MWYGMRTDESAERSKRYEFKDPDNLYHPHEVIGNYPKYLGKNGVRYRLPIVDWYVDLLGLVAFLAWLEVTSRKLKLLNTTSLAPNN